MRSMTGYGKGKGEWNGFTFFVEIYSINSRFIDIQCRIPEFLQGYEYDLRKILTERLLRGNITLKIRTEPEEESLKLVRISSDVVGSYLEEIKNISKRLGLNPDVNVADIIQLPGVIEFRNPEQKIEELYNSLLPVIDEAIEDLINMQRREFDFIKRQLSGFLENCEQILQKIEEKVKTNAQKHFGILKQKIDGLLSESGSGISEERLYTELALIADRYDVTEEIDRLNSHIGQFRKFLDEPMSGKKLNFLLQEMNRETNTLGSKAGISDVSVLVVDLKDLIEKIREQVQNIL